MTWWAVHARPAPDDRERVAAWLVVRTGHAVEERADGVVVAFAGEESNARALAREASTSQGAPATALPVDRVDWTVRWRDGIGQRRIGRLLLTPSWLEYDASDPLVVVLDPETAFGSGEHGSTRAALALLERLLVPEDLMLDLGSGSGILSICAARLGARRAIGVEVDPDANVIARANVARNGVADRVTILDGDAGALAPLLGPAQMVVSNILREVNVSLLPAIRQALAPDGVVIFSGMEQAERELFLPAVHEAGLRLDQQATDDGWWAAAARVA